MYTTHTYIFYLICRPTRGCTVLNYVFVEYPKLAHTSGIWLNSKFEIKFRKKISVFLFSDKMISWLNRIDFNNKCIGFTDLPLENAVASHLKQDILKSQLKSTSYLHTVIYNKSESTDETGG